VRVRDKPDCTSFLLSTSETGDGFTSTAAPKNSKQIPNFCLYGRDPICMIMHPNTNPVGTFN